MVYKRKRNPKLERMLQNLLNDVKKMQKRVMNNVIALNKENPMYSQIFESKAYKELSRECEKLRQKLEKISYQ